MVLGFGQDNVTCHHGSGLLYWQYMPMRSFGQWNLISGGEWAVMQDLCSSTLIGRLVMLYETANGSFPCPLSAMPASRPRIRPPYPSSSKIPGTISSQNAKIACALMAEAQPRRKN